MKYSLIIPHISQKLHLRNCIDSVLESSATDYEILVIDAGDGSSSKELGAFFNHHSNINFIRNSGKTHFSANVNIGIKQAKGENIILLNDDVTLDSNWLETLTRPLDDKNVAIVGGCLLYPDQTHIQHAGVAIAKDAKFWNLFHLDRAVPFEICGRAKTSREITAVTGAVMLIRRQVVDLIGLLDEQFVNGYEDVDYCLRANSRGFKCYYVGEVLGVHHESASGGGFQTENQNFDYWKSKWDSTLSPDFDSENTIKELQLNRLWRNRVISGHSLGNYLDIYAIYEDKEPSIISWLQAQIRTLVSEIYSESDLPVCSIIIPVFNKCELTLQCLESLMQTLPNLAFEIIIVDNASTDDTQEKLSELDFPDNIEFHYCRNEQNENFARACNRGALLAKSKLILFLNNDTLAYPFWMDCALARWNMEQSQSKNPISILGARLLYPDSSIQHGGVQFEYGTPVHISHTKPRFFQFSNQFRKLDAVTAACFLVEKSFFIELQGFDEHYVNGFEDVDLCIRTRLAGKSIGFEPLMELTHFESQTPGRNDNDAKNLLNYFRRWSKVSQKYGLRIDPVPKLEGVSKSLIKEEISTSLTSTSESSEAEKIQAMVVLASRYPKETMMVLINALFGEKAKQPQFFYLLGIIEFFDKNWSAAKNLFVQFLKHFPTNTDAKFMLATTWFQLGEPNRSFPIVAELSSKFPHRKDYSQLLDKVFKAIKENSRKIDIDFHLSFSADKLTSQKPHFDIVMLTRNNWHITERCLSTIQKHSTHPYRIIFVDNASNDGTKQKLANFVESNPNHILINNFENAGFPLGNNLGLSLSNSEIILCLNNDVLVPEHWDKLMLEYFKENEDLDILGPVSNHVAGVQQIPDPAYTRFSQMLSYARKKHAKFGFEIIDSIRVIGFCLAMRNSVLNDLGGFDPDFGIGNFEDDDFCVRAHHSGKKIAYAPGWFIHHIGRQSFQNQVNNYMDILDRNWKFFNKKWGLHNENDVSYKSSEVKFSEDKKYIDLPNLERTHKKINEQIWEQHLSLFPDGTINAL